MAKPKIKHTITKKEWNKKHKDFKLMGKDGIHYIMAYDSKIGTHLVPVKIIDEVSESLGAELDLIKQSSKDIRDFIKKVFSNSDFRDMKSDKDFLKYLKSIYEGVELESVNEFNSSINKRRAGAELKQKLKGKRSDGMGKYTATIYGLDSNGKRVELKSLNDLNKYSKFEIDESVNEGKFDGIGDLVKSLHFEINPKTAEEKKIELGKRQGEVSKPKQKESGEYSLRLFRKKIKYGNGKDVGVFLPGSYAAATSKLGDGPHKKVVKKVRWTQTKYEQWLDSMASNGGARNAFDMAQNAKNEPGLIDWVKKNFRGDNPLQRIQWDIEGFNESLNEKADYKYLTQVILDAKPKYDVYYNSGHNKVNIGGVGYDGGDLVKNFNQKPGSSSKIKNNFYHAHQDPQKTKREVEKLSKGKIKVNVGDRGFLSYSVNESVNEEKVNYNFSEDELKRVLKLLGRNASTEVKMIKAFEKAFGRKLTRDELFELVNEEKVYIDFLNKKKGFKQDRIKFNSYESAVKWAKKNFEKFNTDMIKYESVNESDDVYHKSYTHAIEAAEVYAKKKGYEIEDDEMFTKVGMNSKRPSVGKTTRVSLELLKNGKPQRKMLHIQVYGMKNGYELNAYIN